MGSPEDAAQDPWEPRAAQAARVTDGSEPSLAQVPHNLAPPKELYSASPYNNVNNNNVCYLLRAPCTASPPESTGLANLESEEVENPPQSVRSFGLRLVSMLDAHPCGQNSIQQGAVPPISLLRFLDSNFLGNSLWTWEFHPLNLRL